MNRVRSKPARAIAIIVVAALSFVVAAPATAIDDDKAKSKIVIKKLTKSGAKGVVKSKTNACEPKRKVTLFALDDYVSVKIGITKSKGGGKWRVKKKLDPGKYFAKVDASKAGKTTCLYAVSKTKRL